MTERKGLPDISADLKSGPRLVLPKSAAAATPTDEEVERNTRQLMKVHTVVQTAGAAPDPTLPSSPERTIPVAKLYVEVPEDLLRQIRIKAAQNGTTNAYIVLKALADAGFDVAQSFLVPDRRVAVAFNRRGK